MESHEAIAIAPDGRRMIVGTDRNVLMLWDLATGEWLRTLEGHTLTVNAVALSPDGRHNCLRVVGQTIKPWEFEGGRLLGTS